MKPGLSIRSLYHRLHVVGQNRGRDPAQEPEGVYQTVQKSLHILALRKLHIQHPGPAKGQCKGVQPPSPPVAEMTPVHLRLPSWPCFETNKAHGLTRSIPIRIARCSNCLSRAVCALKKPAN